jgi:hypothetical protein
VASNRQSALYDIYFPGPLIPTAPHSQGYDNSQQLVIYNSTTNIEQPAIPRISAHTTAHKTLRHYTADQVGNQIKQTQILEDKNAERPPKSPPDARRDVDSLAIFSIFPDQCWISIGCLSFQQIKS